METKNVLLWHGEATLLLRVKASVKHKKAIIQAQKSPIWYCLEQYQRIFKNFFQKSESTQ